MKKITTIFVIFNLVLLVSLKPVLAEPADCEESIINGGIDAGFKPRRIGWFAGGLGSGLTLGLIGTGAITFIASRTKPEPKTHPDENIVDIECYLYGYQEKARKKNIRLAIIGGLIGTAISRLALAMASP